MSRPEGLAHLFEMILRPAIPTLEPPPSDAHPLRPHEDGGAATCLDALPPIQRTLAIPLVGRAAAREAFPEMGFSDPVAEAIVARTRSSVIEALRADRPNVWGTIVRTRVLDAVTRDFLRDHPEGTVLTLGAGLCTRTTRISGGRWVDLDTPAVIGARHALLRDPRAVRIGLDLHHVAAFGSVLSDPVIASGPTLVLAEGVLMFLEPAVQRALLQTLHDALPAGSQLAFDWIHPWVSRLALLHTSMRATGARYRSGFRPRTLRTLPRFGPAPRLFEQALGGPRRLLQRLLRTLAFGSPLYEITCLRVNDR